MAKSANKLRKKYYEKFLETLNGLNEAQRQAVDIIEGPVLAIAGPGTGKTHILTARIGQILLQTDTQPHNILCLTFTEAGVHAMRQRLLEFIGPEAHRVHIYTFHSFCNKIIQENLDLFGRNDLEPLSDLERVDIIRTILDNQDIEHPLRIHQRDRYYYENHLRDLFNRMKSERWTPESINEKIDEYLVDLPSRREFIYQRKHGKFQKGDLKTEQINKVVVRMEQLRQATQLFTEYKKLLHQRRRYDYEDMILWVLEAFEQHPFLLRTYQEQYLYILVDEFQDTNGAQSTIIKQLIEYWEQSPNIFIVGDDDQSIYEFQGARVKNMIDFYEEYKQSIALVILKENYRSSQHILDASQSVIDNNELRILSQLQELNLNKELVACHQDFANSPVQVQIVEYPNRAQEEVDIVMQIEQLKKKGIPLNEIAIIFAQHKQAKDIVKLLEKRGIHYETKRRINILELPIIQNVRLLLKYITKEYEQPYSGEDIFFELLHFDFVGLLPADVAKFTAFMASDTNQKYQQRDFKGMLKWRDTLRDTQLLKKIKLKQPKKFREFGAFLDQVILDARNMTLATLLERIINHSGLLHFVTEHAQKSWYTQVIHSFFEFVKRESFKSAKLGLKGLLDIFNQMDANRIGLGIFKVTHADDGVQLITAHSAKGLEFQYVFMINCLKDYWEPSSSYRGRRFTFPDTLTFSDTTDALEANRRLFYVGMTRAKARLQLSFYKENEDRKPQQHVCFIDEILAGNDLDIVSKKLDNEDLLDWQILMLSSYKRPRINLPTAPTLDALLEGFKISVSALNTYLNCQLGFYYQYILRVPSMSSEAAAYGTAVHNALQRIIDTANAHKSKKLPHVEEFLLTFQQELERQRPYFTTDSFEHNKQLGLRQLPRYYEARAELWNNSLKKDLILTEKAFRNVEIDGVPITGVIDKVVVHSHNGRKRIQVIDYKTGMLKRERLQPASTKKPLGGNYWRQLLFYKILLETANFTNYKVRSAAIDYITPDKKGTFPLKTVELEQKEVKIVKELIKATYDNIMNHQFAEGCGKRGCKWCNFARRNVVVDSFNNEEAEMMDD
ncbi:MAG: ATP-dependent helicase [Aureispira sp.]|nr:ATP-dependent helicase [Aureispira sp.]